MDDLNAKMGVSDGHGGWKLRVFHRKGKGKKSARYLIKCGCCDAKVEIFYDEQGLEINKVCASKEEWRQVLRHLLE